MEKIFGSQRYNPETAEKIGFNRIGRARRYCGYIDEILYRTSNGNWFLLAISRVDQIDPEKPFIFKTNSNHIIPVNNNDAYKWLKLINHTKALEKFFP